MECGVAVYCIWVGSWYVVIKFWSVNFCPELASLKLFLESAQTTLLYHLMLDDMQRPVLVSFNFG